ncbi:MAG TPA: hypothetical protein VKZ53_24265 [Candidatus Angelobacter sp.]|nr:hypothetical protein [Candidatus Angelobacter sp.]
MANSVPAGSCQSVTGAERAETEHGTRYLHLSAFPCERCSGPVIAGWFGIQHDDISNETGIQDIGAACLACGSRPQVMVEPLAGHRFRPVEWEWAIREKAQPADGGDDSLAAELSQDADTVRQQPT